MTIFKFLIISLVLGSLVLWVLTWFIVRDIERTFPPIGEFRSINNARVHFVDTGPVEDQSRPAVIFIHGASGNLREMQMANGGRLKDEFRLIFVDRPGHGYSDPFPGSNDPKQQAGSIAGLMDVLEIPNAVIVGHSFGGVVTGAFGVLYPEKTSGLVFLAPVSHPWPTGVDWHYDIGNMPYVGWLFTRLLVTPIGSLIYPGAVERVFLPDTMPENYKELSGTRLVLRPQNFHENAKDVARVIHHVREFQHRYQEIKAPTIILHGDQDSTVSLEIHSINGLSKDIEGAELRILEGMGHMPNHMAADDVADIIRNIAERSDP